LEIRDHDEKLPQRGLYGHPRNHADAARRRGAIDTQTMREFDQACLLPAVPISPERERLSQPVFTRHMNADKNLISDWKHVGQIERSETQHWKS
jgi:hypothetical protein